MDTQDPAGPCTTPKGPRGSLAEPRHRSSYRRTGMMRAAGIETSPQPTLRARLEAPARPP